MPTPFRPAGLNATSAVLAELARLWDQAVHRSASRHIRVSQKELAKASQVSVTTVNSWATGASLPRDLDRLQAVGGVLAGWAGEASLTGIEWSRLMQADQAARARAVPSALGTGPHAGLQNTLGAYLRALVSWLDVDPWPQDRRFGGPVLTPSSIERRLRLAAGGLRADQDLDADTLAAQCRRLVVLGGPGSGKTWLARRIVRRSAAKALKDLEAGASLDDVELPLYTTCSRLFGENGDIRQAVVSSALHQLGDLGGSKIIDALNSAFTERNAPTLLVIDGLDEANGSDERLRQADTLPWRVILTSRPGSWNQQLHIKTGDGSCQVGKLRPLRYPEDIEAFIEGWFSRRPEQGRDLLSQIMQRPALKGPATVPLILAFYCIVADDAPLPVYRHELYARVINRVLSGRWRRSDDHKSDLQACLGILRQWAWLGATSDAFSGVGAWTDEIQTAASEIAFDYMETLGHVAAPEGRADIDTAKVPRRFIHRSIREHLVAEYVAGLPVKEAVEALLPHIWFDRDWEYSAPAAVAMHPEREGVLKELLCAAAKCDEIPEEVSTIDAGWEFQTFLSRLAAETCEADWPDDVARLIGDARVKVSLWTRLGDIGGKSMWPRSDRQVCDALLKEIDHGGRGGDILSIVEDLTNVPLTPRENHEVRRKLLRRLTYVTEPWLASELAVSLALLGPEPHEAGTAREALFKLLVQNAYAGEVLQLVDGFVRIGMTAEDNQRALGIFFEKITVKQSSHLVSSLVSAMTCFEPTSQDKHKACQLLLELLAEHAGGHEATELARGMLQLGCGEGERRVARDAMLRLFASRPYDWGFFGPYEILAQLAPAAEDKREVRQVLLSVLVRESSGHMVKDVVAAIDQFNPTPKEKERIRQKILELLSRKNDGSLVSAWVDAIGRLSPTARDMKQLQQVLIHSMANCIDYPTVAELLAPMVAKLATTVENKQETRQKLLGLLASENNKWIARGLIDCASRLDLTAEEKQKACQSLIRLLAIKGDYSTEACALANWISRLDPSPESKRDSRAILMRLLTSENIPSRAQELVAELVRLDPTLDDRRQAREHLLGLLRKDAFLYFSIGFDIRHVADGLAVLGPTANDKERFLRVALGSLRQTSRKGDRLSERGAKEAAHAVAQFHPEARRKHQAVKALLHRLADNAGAHRCDRDDAQYLTDAVTALAVAPADKRHASRIIIDMLVTLDGRPEASRATDHLRTWLINLLVQLDPTTEEKREARAALVKLLPNKPDDFSFASRESFILEEMIQLDPCVTDLVDCQRWASAMTAELLSAARRNSRLDDWIAALPELPVSLQWRPTR
jgi:NACHT domain-containing protein